MFQALKGTLGTKAREQAQEQVQAVSSPQRYVGNQPHARTTTALSGVSSPQRYVGNTAKCAYAERSPRVSSPQRYVGNKEWGDDAVAALLVSSPQRYVGNPHAPTSAWASAPRFQALKGTLGTPMPRRVPGRALRGFKPSKVRWEQRPRSTMGAERWVSSPQRYVGNLWRKRSGNRRRLFQALKGTLGTRTSPRWEALSPPPASAVRDE